MKLPINIAGNQRAHLSLSLSLSLSRSPAERLLGQAHGYLPLLSTQPGDGHPGMVQHARRPADDDHGPLGSVAELLIQDVEHVHALADEDLLVDPGQGVLQVFDDRAAPRAPEELGPARVRAEKRDQGGDADAAGDADQQRVARQVLVLAVGGLDEHRKPRPRPEPARQAALEANVERQADLRGQCLF